jgi:hypothetical protein
MTPIVQTGVAITLSAGYSALICILITVRAPLYTINALIDIVGKVTAAAGAINDNKLC